MKMQQNSIIFEPWYFKKYIFRTMIIKKYTFQTMIIKKYNFLTKIKKFHELSRPEFFSPFQQYAVLTMNLARTILAKLIKRYKITKSVKINKASQKNLPVYVKFLPDQWKICHFLAENLPNTIYLNISDRESIKHIILDCPANIAKQMIVKHVQTIVLGEQ